MVMMYLLKSSQTGSQKGRVEFAAAAMLARIGSGMQQLAQSKQMPFSEMHANGDCCPIYESRMEICNRTRRSANGASEHRPRWRSRSAEGHSFCMYGNSCGWIHKPLRAFRQIMVFVHMHTSFASVHCRSVTAFLVLHIAPMHPFSLSRSPLIHQAYKDTRN